MLQETVISTAQPRLPAHLWKRQAVRVGWWREGKEQEREGYASPYQIQPLQEWVSNIRRWASPRPLHEPQGLGHPPFYSRDILHTPDRGPVLLYDSCFQHPRQPRLWPPGRWRHHPLYPHQQGVQPEIQQLGQLAGDQGSALGCQGPGCV